MSDQIVEPALCLGDQLEQSNQVEVNRSPSIQELQSLAEKGQASLLEYGTQALKIDDGTTKYNL